MCRLGASSPCPPPPAARRRWGTEADGDVDAFDPGGAAVVPPGGGAARRAALSEALGAERYEELVVALVDGPELADR